MWWLKNIGQNWSHIVKKYQRYVNCHPPTVDYTPRILVKILDGQPIARPSAAVKRTWQARRSCHDKVAPGESTYPGGGQIVQIFWFNWIHVDSCYRSTSETFQIPTVPNVKSFAVWNEGSFGALKRGPETNCLATFRWESTDKVTSFCHAVLTHKLEEEWRNIKTNLQ